MPTVSELLREHLLEQSGVVSASRTTRTYEELRKTEWSPRFEAAMRRQLGGPWDEEFEEAMRVRLVMGAFRYGTMGDPRKPSWDRLARVERDLEAYHRDGLLERLVDSANHLALEAEEGPEWICWDGWESPEVLGMGFSSLLRHAKETKRVRVLARIAALCMVLFAGERRAGVELVPLPEHLTVHVEKFHG